MAYDQDLAGRVRELLSGQAGYTEKMMFGGIAFLVNGNMACGVLREELIVRTGPAAYARALQLPHVRPFDLTCRPMPGWVMVAPAATRKDGELASWVAAGAGFAGTLPAK